MAIPTSASQQFPRFSELFQDLAVLLVLAPPFLAASALVAALPAWLHGNHWQPELWLAAAPLLYLLWLLLLLLILVAGNSVLARFYVRPRRVVWMQGKLPPPAVVVLALHYWIRPLLFTLPMVTTLYGMNAGKWLVLRSFSAR